MISTGTFLIYLCIMAGTTYAIRVLPFVVCKEKIKNTFIKSFLAYIPFAVLGAMTFPAIFYSTGSIISGIIGTVTALVLSYKGKSLLTVAVSACIVVFLTDWILL